MEQQQRQFREIASDAGANGEPVIVAGDFNATIWGSSMQALLSTAKLRSTAEGFGWQPTLPRSLVQWKLDGVDVSNSLLMVPIDHCLINERLGVTSFSLGGNVGSDHTPLFIEVTPKKKL